MSDNHHFTVMEAFIGYCLTIPLSEAFLYRQDRESETVAEVITRHKSTINFQDIDNSHTIKIRRNRLWDDACTEFSKDFDHSKPLQVQFVGEDGIDGGGLRREFFSLAIQKAGNLLEGPSDRKVFRHNLVALNCKKYKILGTIVAFSVIYGGPLPSYLSPPIVHYLLYGHDGSNCNATVDDIPSKEFKAKILKVRL